MNSRDKYSLSRRRFLGGAGAMVALPFLESIAPRLAHGAATTAPRRLLFFYVPNGIHMPSWTPGRTGTNYDLPLILEPLADISRQVNVLTGLANPAANPDGPGDHAAGTASFLTATHVRKTSGSDIQNGISVDQVAANALGSATLFPSLQLGLEGGANVGTCDSGYSCAYTRNISWAGPATPLPKIIDPRLMFDRLFGGSDGVLTAEQIARRHYYRTSILDYVREETEALKPRLGYRDRLKLDEYLAGLRALETRIEASAAEPNVCPAPDPASVADRRDGDFQALTRSMIDLMVVAMQCDLSRFISFMLGNAGSNRSYDFLGVSGSHHSISHHQSRPENLARLEIIDRWEVEQFAYLLKRMAAVEEEGGSMLDNSLVLFSSEIEDGDYHRHSNMPVLLAGSGGGSVTPGRHIVYQDTPTFGDLYIAMLASVGVNVETFGDDGTGPLPGLS